LPKREEKNYNNLNQEFVEGATFEPINYPTTAQRFDNIEFLKKNIPLGARVYICGTPQINKSIYNKLKKLGFSDYQLFIV